jgi:hypothetical protein
MEHALDREVDDRIADWLRPCSVGCGVTGVVQEGQDDKSGEFVVVYHLVTISKPNS